MLPHLTERETISNINSAPETSNENENCSENVEVDLEHSHIEASLEQNTPSMSSQVKKKKIRGSSTDTNVEKETAASKLMKYILNKEKADAQKSADCYPIDAFLSGIAPVLKNLSPYNQYVARTKIFAIDRSLHSSTSASVRRNDSRGTRGRTTSKFQSVSVPPCVTLRDAGGQCSMTLTTFWYRKLID